MNIKSADTASFLQRGRRQHITWCSQMIFVWTPPQVENTAEGPSEGSHLRTVVLYRSLFNIQFYSCFFSTRLLEHTGAFLFYILFELGQESFQHFQCDSEMWQQGFSYPFLLLDKSFVERKTFSGLWVDLGVFC